MKKKIKNSQELLIGLASKGDAAAFYSLAVPLLKEIFHKFRSQGISSTDASEKVISIAIELFKKIKHHEPLNFAEWFHAESHTPAAENESEAEIFFDKEQVAECEKTLATAQLELLRTASKQTIKIKKISILQFIKSNPVTISISVIALCLLCWLIQFTFFSDSTITIVLSSKETQKSFSYPSFDFHTIELTDTVTEAVQTKPKPHVDSIPKADTVVAAPVEPKAPPVKPVVKTYPRSNPIQQFESSSGINESIHQTQSSTESQSGYSSARTERSYSSQSQIRETQPTEQSSSSPTQSSLQSTPSTFQSESSTQ